MPDDAIIDELPQPGEPLAPFVDPENKRLVDDEIAKRLKRLKSKLTPRQLRQHEARYKALWKKLNKAKYNQLVKERFELSRAYEKLKYLFRKHPQHRAKIRASAEKVRARGIWLGKRLNELKPLSDEFDYVCNAIKAHKDVVEWERKEREDKAQFILESRVWEQQIKGVFKQSPRLHHAGSDSRGKGFVKIPTISKAIHHEDRVLYHIKVTGQSLFERLLGRWHSALPYGVDIKDLTCDETLENLSVACNRVVTVERSKKGQNVFYCVSRLDGADGLPHKVLYSKCLDWYPSDIHYKTPWIGGVANGRKVKYYNFEDSPHILIAGATQSGKSNHVNQMISTLVTMNTPDELRLMLVDLKGGIEFTHWEGLSHQLGEMVKSANEVLDALKYLRGLMESRLAEFQKIKAKNLLSYNKKATNKLPRIIMIIDEMSTLIGLGGLTSDIQNELRVISSQGRAVGINLILCTQHPSVDTVPGWVKTNMSLRISGKMPNHQASQIVLDTITAAALPSVAGRMVISFGRWEDIVQSPYISDEEIAKAVAISQEKTAPKLGAFGQSLDDTQPITPVTVDEFVLNEDTLIQLALDHFDGALKARRIYEHLEGQDIKRASIEALIKEITSHNEINHRGIVYKFKAINGGAKKLVLASSQLPNNEVVV